MRIGEGKEALSFEGYRFIANTARKKTKDFEVAVFAHLFLLLCWNLIARCMSVSSLMLNHIRWDTDAIVIVFPTHKGDEEGDDCSPKHVYANPSCPDICPVLALAIFIWCMGHRRDGAKPMLFGAAKATESRFSNWLKKALGANLDSLIVMGILIVEIGTHSFRKGVATFLSGLVSGPSAVAIYLRAGWSLGPVQKRYILEGQGGDQLCGRTATGLAITEPEFADLPPHFDLSQGEILSLTEWEEILPGYCTFYPLSFRQVLPFLLASLVYHAPYLRRELDARHPLFLTRLWTSGLVDTLSSKVYAGAGRNPVTKLCATGIPPHILLANEMIKMREEIKELKDGIIQKLDNLPDLVKESMLRNFQIDGTVPITHEQVLSMLNTVQSSLLQAMQEQTTKLQAACSPAIDTNASSSFVPWSWGERFHPVPDTFRFPKCNTKALWDLWWSGNTVERYPPYRKLYGYDLKTKSDEQLLSRAKKVMKTLLEFHPTQVLSTNAVTSLSIGNRDKYFELSFINLFKTLRPNEDVETFDRRRIGDISFLTLYDLISKKHI